MIRAPLFPSWADSVLRLALLVLVGAVVGAPACAMVWVRSAYSTGEANPVRQPVAFDHRHHVRDVGIDCRFCHQGVEQSPVAGVPPTALCMGCHGQIWNQAAVLAPVRESAFSGKPIAWTRVNKLPAHVFFDHSIHVTRGVACVTCHGRVDHMAQVVAAAPLTMKWCLDCHRDAVPNLRPIEAVTDMDWSTTDPRGVGAAVAASLGGVHPPTHCTGCHR
jgi:hypothetical protein